MDDATPARWWTLAATSSPTPRFASLDLSTAPRPPPRLQTCPRRLPCHQASQPLLPPRRPPLRRPHLPPRPRQDIHHLELHDRVLRPPRLPQRRPRVIPLSHSLSFPFRLPRFDDSFTCPVTIKAYWDLEWGKQIHSLACKLGFVCNVFVSASFVHMYSRLGFTDDARKNGRTTAVTELFERMMMLGLPMDKVTVTSILPVCNCTPLQNPLSGLCIHVYCIKHGMDSDLFVSNALIDMYAKLGHLEEAHKVFKGMVDRDLVTWNSIISGYEQTGDANSALNVLIYSMRCSRVAFNLID
ncbi:pentatricopeptide repeat-containing protein At1g11290, chloroplastic-like [Zingiber officinale]|uniref:Pentatricopeptide repeat-containing protein n=1 Tax=Zingiber officinale TaxID=94328 RepID=A0A8J5FPG0_ZINOF|nr:pentatricopeptide repeat-containing protein At1g11290, chloroplastic-like [Zingiber officinale]KAG6488856.1 hypothetical protein ZIOFF_050110 [Zingiber officinale]